MPQRGPRREAKVLTDHNISLGCSAQDEHNEFGEMPFSPMAHIDEWCLEPTAFDAPYTFTSGLDETTPIKPQFSTIDYAGPEAPAIAYRDTWSSSLYSDLLNYDFGCAKTYPCSLNAMQNLAPISDFLPFNPYVGGFDNTADLY